MCCRFPIRTFSSPRGDAADGRSGRAGLHHRRHRHRPVARYADGARTIYGHGSPTGSRKNTALPEPIVTPTTKGPTAGTTSRCGCRGRCRRPRARQPVGAVSRRRHSSCSAAAPNRAPCRSHPRRHQVRVRHRGDGNLLLIDEVHTPDSSRYWVDDSYEERLAAGDEPESLDKEVVRRALATAGYTGDGPIPELPADVWSATARRYIDAYERLTGLTFVPGAYPLGPRINAALAGLDSTDMGIPIAHTPIGDHRRISTPTTRRTRSAVCSASRRLTVKAWPSSRSSACSPCSTAARRRPASP